MTTSRKAFAVTSLALIALVFICPVLNLNGQESSSDPNLRLVLDTLNQRFNLQDKYMNQRFDAVDQRLDAIDKRLDSIENRVNAVESLTDRVKGGLDTLMILLGVGTLAVGIIKLVNPRTKKPTAQDSPFGHIGDPKKIQGGLL